MNKNPLLDEEFLKELYTHRQKEIFAKLIALTLEEDPIEEIQGQVTGGSVNLDGTSNVRRTCNLTLVAKNLDINQYYWGLKTKFRLYVGLANTVGWNYEDIIWFPMGTYVISSFSTSQSTNNYTISIAGKDKMCLINGDMGGSLFASVDFGKTEIYDSTTGETEIKDIPIKDIIRESIHAYANESWENIIINDLDDYGINLLDYDDPDNPAYFFFKQGSIDKTRDCDHWTINGDEIVYPLEIKDGEYVVIDRYAVDGIKVSEIENYPENFKYDPRITSFNDVELDNVSYFKIQNSESIYTIGKITQGQTCGYYLTDITYAGDLVISVGEPITVLLDKLVAMLGNFEYFYDLEGRFVFQRKRTYTDKTWNNITIGNSNLDVTRSDEIYADAAAYSSSVSWVFGNSYLTTTYSNAPVLNNVKNDFSIWGTKRSVTGSELPVHLRFAVDKKPTYYKTLDGVEWTTETHSGWVKIGEGPVDITYEELSNLVKEEAKQKVRKRIEREIKNFSLEYPPIQGLQTPIKKADGSWTSGWWDIRDWHKYYKILTGHDPTYHMRMYATNSNDDVTRPKGYVENFDFSNIFNGPITGTKNINKLWLFNAYKYEDGSFYVDTEHNMQGSNPSTLVDDDGISRTYYPPFNGCTAHTYSFFEEWFNKETYNNKKIVKAYGYFYAPNFPEKMADSDFDQFIDEEVEAQLTEEEINATIAEKGYYYIERKAENLCDWREIIFQMALDYRKHNHDDDFLLKLRNQNGKNINDQWYYPSGKTGYEQYYIDLEGFWRQLYCPPQLMKKLFRSGVWTERANTNQITWWKFATGAITEANEEEGIMCSSTGYMYNLKAIPGLTLSDFILSFDAGDQWINSWIEYQDENDGWNVQVIEEPSTINFWFDFLDADEDADLSKYSVPAIGDRAKSVNDNNVKAIYFRETPNAIFVTDLSTSDKKAGYTYLQYDESMKNIFKISSQGKSAIDVMEEFLNKYLYCIESISITSVPVYHLQPNTRVTLYDEDSKINGDYLVSRITIPLTYNGMMNVSATKSAEIIY